MHVLDLQSGPKALHKLEPSVSPACIHTTRNDDYHVLFRQTCLLLLDPCSCLGDIYD